MMNDLDRTQRVVEIQQNSSGSNGDIVITFSQSGSTTKTDMSDDCATIDRPTALRSSGGQKAENLTAERAQCALSTSDMDTDVVVMDSETPDLIVDEPPLVVVLDDATAAPDLKRLDQTGTDSDLDTSSVLLYEESDNEDIVWVATVPVVKSEVKRINRDEKSVSVSNSVVSNPESSASSSAQSMKEGPNKASEICAASKTCGKHGQACEICVDHEIVAVPTEIEAVAATASSSSTTQLNNKHCLSEDDSDDPVIVSEVKAVWPTAQFSAACDKLFPGPSKLMVQPQNQMHLPGPNLCTRNGPNFSRGFPIMDRRIDRPVFNSRQMKLRPIAIDGSNVAFSHGRNQLFSCRGIQLCIDYFVQRGHTTIKAFVPQFRRQSDPLVIDRDILEELGKCQLVVFTPSRRVLGQNIVCHDDRFVLEYAERSGAVIVSNDNFREFQNTSLAWEQIIRCRLLMYAFADDIFLVPSDPLGRHGLTLDNFLCF